MGQATTSIIHTLTDLGYSQSETEIFYDNECAVGIAQNTLQINRAKTIDMRYQSYLEGGKTKLGRLLHKSKSSASSLGDPLEICVA